MISRERLTWLLKGIRFAAAAFGVVGASFVLVTMYWGSSLIPAWFRGDLPAWPWRVYWTAMFPFPGSILCFTIMYGLTNYKKWTMYPLVLFALAFPSLQANALFWIGIVALIIVFFRHPVVKEIFTD